MPQIDFIERLRKDGPLALFVFEVNSNTKMDRPYS